MYIGKKNPDDYGLENCDTEKKIEERGPKGETAKSNRFAILRCFAPSLFASRPSLFTP